MFRRIAFSMIAVLFSVAAQTHSAHAQNLFPFSEEGLTRSHRIALQVQLIEFGYLKGRPDGEFGSRTRDAIKLYQQQLGTPQTGVFAQAELNQIANWGEYQDAFLKLDGGKVPPDPTDPLIRTNCAAIQQELDAIASTVAIEIDANEARVGQLFDVKWAAQATRSRLPVYLFIASDRPVRLKGEGFYALLPGAPGPFGISAQNDNIRVILPRYGAGVEESGVLEIRPTTLSPITITADLVAATGCGELRRSLTSKALKVTGGKPVIVLDSSFDLTSRGETIESPAGDRIVEFRDGRFLLRDKGSGVIIAEYTGTTPRFSPSGRFLTAFFAERLTVVDSIDGAVVNVPKGGDVAWDFGESFVIVGGTGLGNITVASPIIEGRTLGGASGGCRVCWGVDTTAVKIDLENNVILSRSLNGATGASPLTGAAYDDRRAYGNAALFVAATSQLTKLRYPKVWETKDKLRFTLVADHPDDVHKALRAKFLIEPIVRPATSGGKEAPTSLPEADFEARLTDFGIDFPAPSAFIDVPGIGSKVVDNAEITLPFGSEYKARVTPFIECSEYDEISLEGSTTFIPVYDGFTVSLHQADNRTVAVLSTQCMAGSAAFLKYSTYVWDSASGLPPIELTELIGDYSQRGNNECEIMVTACSFGLGLVADRFILFWSGESRAIAAYDLMERRISGSWANLDRADLMQSARLSPSGDRILQVNKDGTFEVYRTGSSVQTNGHATTSYANAALILSGAYSDDELVSWTPEGQYDATYEGTEQVRIRIPGSTALHSFDQFMPALRVPNLAADVLAGKPLPPVPNVGIPPQLEATLSANAGLLIGDAILDRSDKLDLRVYQDGLVTEAKIEEAADGHTRISADRLPGSRWATVVAVSADGLASLPLSVDLGKSETPRGVYTLAVGFDQYTSKRLRPLKYAKFDALRFSLALGNAAASRGASVKARSYGDVGATLDGLLAEIEAAIAASSPQTDVHIFFAGHGLNADGKYYLALPDSDVDDLAATALDWSRVSELLASAKGRVFIYLDACHSGGTGESYFSSNDAAAGAILDKVPSGITLFAAAKGRQESLESSAGGGGYFTSALLAGLQDKADLNGNGAIEVDELYVSVKRRVGELSEGRQTPWLVHNAMIGSISILW